MVDEPIVMSMLLQVYIDNIYCVAAAISFIPAALYEMKSPGNMGPKTQYMSNILNRLMSTNHVSCHLTRFWRDE